MLNVPLKALILANVWTLVAASYPLWQNLLAHHWDWEGEYVHNENSYSCTMRVVSGSYVVFTAQHVSMDMEASSDDDVIVRFEEQATWNKTHHFQDHTQIKIVGQFFSDHVYYVFLGNVSSAEAANFANVSLRPKGIAVRTHKPKDLTSLKYGLALGIPLTLAALLTVVGVMMMWWAVRKGYLRHVSWAYKNFRNPKQTKSSLELSDAGGGAPNQSVHI